MERRISPLFGVFSKNPLQVQLFSHQAQYKVHQMPRWYPIQHRWRHQLILFWNPISKCLRHAPIQFLSTVKYGPHYLDRPYVRAQSRCRRIRSGGLLSKSMYMGVEGVLLTSSKREFRRIELQIVWCEGLTGKVNLVVTDRAYQTCP